jgi:hypothetical protein
MKKFNRDLANIYKDIQNIEIKPTDSFKTSLNKFYAVMRKWGIKQGEWSENGRTVVNAEWNMCWQVFKSHKILALDLWLLLSEPPKDLLAYGKKPKDNTYTTTDEKGNIVRKIKKS